MHILYNIVKLLLKLCVKTNRNKKIRINLAYKKSASIKSTGGFVKVSMISSNSLNDEVKYFDDSQSLWPFVESDTFFMDLVL